MRCRQVPEICWALTAHTAALAAQPTPALLRIPVSRRSSVSGYSDASRKNLFLFQDILGILATGLLYLAPPPPDQITTVLPSGTHYCSCNFGI